MLVQPQNAASRTVFSDPPNVIVVADSVAIDLLQDETATQGSISFRGIQNLGNNALNISFNTTCTATEFHVQLGQGQQLDCSDDRQRVSGFCVGGTTVATNVKRRLDTVPI